MSGIQAWNGTVPSLVPKPMNSRSTMMTDAVAPTIPPTPSQSWRYPLPVAAHMHP